MSSRHHFVTRGLTLTAAAAFTVGAGGLVGTSTASADARGTALGTQVYDLSAEAVALQTTMTDPGLPFGIPFSVGSYGASTVLNSNGESTADAGAPYSPLVSSLPNTSNGLAQSVFGFGLPVVPSFPGYVSAKDPVLPTNKQNAGGYELIASALPQAASGKVSLGGQAATSEENNAFAVANSLAEAEGIVTEAAAGVHALTLGGILDLANVSSFASLTQQVGGTVVPVTTTSLGTISFAGLVSGVTGDGVTALGSAPTPLSVDGLAPLNDALKPVGVTLTYLPQEYSYTDGSTSTGPTATARKTVAGVTSGALRIFLTNASDRGTTTETITLGRVAVKATSSTIGGAAGTDVGGATAGTDTAVIDGGALPGTDAGTNLAAAPGVGTAPATGAESTGTLPTQSFVPAVAELAAGRIDGAGTISFEGFYLIVIFAGAVALVGGQLVRVVAVRRSV